MAFLQEKINRNTMGRKVTEKRVRIMECWRDATEVYYDYFAIKYSDFGKHRIRRRIDRQTGKPFLSITIKYDRSYLP